MVHDILYLCGHNCFALGVLQHLLLLLAQSVFTVYIGLFTFDFRDVNILVLNEDHTTLVIENLVVPAHYLRFAHVVYRLQISFTRVMIIELLSSQSVLQAGRRYRASARYGALITDHFFALLSERIRLRLLHRIHRMLRCIPQIHSLGG